MSQTKAQLLDNIKDNVQLDAQKALRFADSDSSHYVAFRAPGTVSSSVTWTLPAADGSANYVLATDGSGTLSWIADPAGQWVTSGSNIYFTGGNVGIGDNSPSNPLSVTGASAFNGDVQFTGASYNVTWDKSADDLIFDDNAKAIFGTSSDGLEIYHDGSTSTIKDSGTGNLNFQGSHFDFINAAGNEYSARLYNDGEVQLYFNGNEKLNTVTDGINLTGSLQFADDTNTHLAHPASDVLAITTAGSERLRVDASGNVGIGTNSPSSLLHIVGGTGANVLINAATHDASAANQARLQLGFVHSGGQALAHLKLDEAANNSFDGLLKIGVPYNNGSGGSTTREVIEADFNGNICLPGSTVTWDTTARTNGLQLYYETDAGVATIGSYSSGGSTALTFATNSGGGAAAERMRINASGYVGIGTTSPDKTGIQNNVSVLQIDSGDGAELILGNSTSSNVSTNHIGAIAFKNIDSSTGNAPHFAGIRSNCADTSGNMNLKFYGGSTEFEADTPHMVIHETGVVTVGTATKNASDRLTVLDPGTAFMSIRSDSHADGNSQILDFGVGTSNRASGNLTASIEADIHSTSGGTLKSDLLFFTNSGDNLNEKLRIKDTGYVGIGVNPSNLLHLYHATTNTLLRIQSGDATAGMEFFDNSTTSGNQPIVGCKGNDYFIETGGLEQFRVSSNGNLKWKAHSSSNHVWTRKAFGDVSLSAGATQTITITEGFTNNTCVRGDYCFNWNDGNGGAWGIFVAWKHHDANWNHRFIESEVASPAESVDLSMNGNNLTFTITMSSGSGMNGRWMMSVDQSSPNEPYAF